MFDAWIVKFKPFASASVLIVLFEITTKYCIKTYLDQEKPFRNNLTSRFCDSSAGKRQEYHEISADIRRENNRK